MNKLVEPPLADRPASAPEDLRLQTGSMATDKELAVEGVVRAMASALGIQLDGLTVSIDEEAGRHVQAHGARGRASADLVELDPFGFDAGTVSGRALLAHEMTHVAQARLAHGSMPPSLRDAEAEARENAGAAAAGRPLRMPLERITSPAFDAARDLPAPAVTPLDTLVRRNYTRERARIIRLLDGLIVTDGEVERVLRILEPLAFETAASLIATLDSAVRVRLVNELDSGHYARFSPAIVAVLEALEVEEIQNLDRDALYHLPFTDLGVAELRTIQFVFGNLPHAVQVDLSEGERRDDFLRLRRTEPAEYNRQEAREELARIEEQRSAAVVLAGDTIRAAVDSLTQDLLRLLEDPGEQDTRNALIRIGELNVSATPDPRDAAVVQSATEAEQAERDVREATTEEASGAATRALPPQATPTPETPQPTLDAAALRIVASRLDEAGAIERLIDELPEDDRRQQPFRDAFRRLMSARSAHRNLALVEELLDPGWWFFGWVDRHEAMLAYDIVMSMQLGERERFRTLEGGDALRRMLDALPDTFRQDPDFVLPEVARTADGALIEAERLYAPGGLRESEAELVGATLELFRDREQRREIQAKLDALIAVARLDNDQNDVAAPRPEAVLGTLVRRLDAEGLLEPFLEKLEPAVLATRETWPQMAAIMVARDPVLARRQVLRLLRERTILLFISLDSVEPREAFLAFQMVRVLPAQDREALAAEQGGEPWARMLSQLSNEVLADAGNTFFQNELDRFGTTSIRQRINDDALWDGTHDDQLIVLIELARAAGDFQYVFDYSRLLHDAGRTVPGPIMARFRLYDPAAERTVPDPPSSSIEIGGTSTAALLFGSSWRELDLNWVAHDPVDIMGSEVADYSVSGIRLTADLEQLQEIRGGRLHSSVEVERSPGEREAITARNREDLLDTPNVIDMFIDLERGTGLITAHQLRLDNLRNISGSSTFRTGPVTIDNLELHLNFERGDLIDLTAVRAGVGGVNIDTPVYASEDSIYAARRAVLTTLDFAIGDFSQERPESPIVGHLFGMIMVALWRTYVSGAQLLENPLERAALFDRIEMSFDSLTVDELQTSGGQRVRRATVRDARVAAATNRAAYQRLLIASLTERLESATNPGDREELQTRLSAASAELTRYEELEIEYRDLVRQMNRQDGQLTDVESARLTQLQEEEGIDVGSRMGAIVDIGQISVEGIEGSVRANDVVLNDLHGEGSFRELGGLTIEQLTTEESINRFVEFGPEALQTHPEGERASDTSFALELGTASIGGLVVQGEIPSAADVLEAHAELPGHEAFNTERARLFALAGRLLAFETLHAADEPEDAAARIAHRRRLMEERRALAELFGSSVDLLTATDIRLGATPASEERLRPREGDENDGSANRGRGNVEIGDLKLEGARHGSLRADLIHGVNLRGSVQLRTPGLSSFGDPDSQIEVAVFGGERLVIENARQGDSPNRADTVVIEGFDGVARLTNDGLLIENFVINDLTVTNAHYRTTSAYLWTEGATTVHDITLNMRIPFEAAASENAEGGEEHQSPAFSRLDTSVMHIDHLHIGHIAADMLGYRGFDDEGGFSKEVVVESGMICGIDVRNFTLNMPDEGDMGYDGDVTIQTLNEVRFSSRIGESLTARGRLDTTARGEDDPAISIDIANANEIYVDLDRINLSEGTVDLRSSSGTGRVRVSRAEITSQIAMVGNEIRVSSLRIPDLAMPSVEWHTNEGVDIEAENAHLRNFRLRLNYITEDDDHSRVELNELYIGAMSAHKIEYHDPPGMHLVLNPRDDDENQQLPLIQGLLLQDLTINIGPDSFSMSGGHGRVQNADFVASALMTAQTGSGPNRYEGVTGLFANVSAGGINFADLGYSDDGLTISGGAERLSAEGGFTVMPSGSDSPPSGAMVASGDFRTGIGRLGNFRYGGGVISIGPDGTEGLTFPEIVLESLSFESGDYALSPIGSMAAADAEPGSATESTALSSITASGLELNMDIHLRQDPEPEGDEAEATTPEAEAERSAIDRIDIHKLHLDSIALQGYRLHLRQKGVFIDIPSGLDASISDIDLHGPLPGEPFSISLDGPSPRMLGSISTGAILAQQIGVQMADGLRARLDFEAASANLGFLEATDPDSDEAGPMSIDLTDWSATNILAYVGEGTSTRLRVGRDADVMVTGTGQGIGGSSLNIEMGEDGSLSVALRGLWARGFELRDQALRIALTLGQVRMPDEDILEYLSEPSSVTSGNIHQRVRISQLDVDNAYLLIMDLNHMIRELGGPDIDATMNTMAGRAADPNPEADTDPALLSQSVLTWVRNNEALFRTLQGRLRADVQFELGSVTTDYGTLHPQIDLQIEDGNLDIEQMEDQLTRIDELGGTTAGLANLKFDPNTSEPTLVFGIGGHVPVVETDPMGHPIDPMAEPVEADMHYNLYEWRMAQDEIRVIRGTRRTAIGIDTLLRVQDSRFDPNPEEEEEEAPTQTLAEQFSGLRVNNFQLELETDNANPLPISLGEYGSLTLAPQSLQNFSISGNLQPYNFTQFEGMVGERIFQSLHRDSTTRPGQFALNLDQLAVSEMDINLPAFSGSNITGGSVTGGVSISDVTDLSLDFRGLVPRQLSGGVGNISLTDIEINLEEFVPTGPNEPSDAEFVDVPIFREEEEGG